MAPTFPRRWIASLQARFLQGTILILLVVMVAVMVTVEHRQRAAIVAEVQRRGEVIARNLAALSQGPLMLYNYTALEQYVARVAGEAELVYATILDADGHVAAHGRHPHPGESGTPLHIPGDEQAAHAQSFEVRELVLPESGEPVYDFAVPVIVNGQRWGTVRIGLSRQSMEAEIRATRNELGLLTVITLILGAAAAALVARRIARPVRALSHGVAAIARGELNQRIPITGSDELGRLAVAFNHMASQLFQQHTALETAHSELRRHYEELADLKGYTDSIVQSLSSGIVTLDLDGRIVTMNAAAELLTGLFAPEAAGRYCSEVFAHSPEAVEVLMETLARRTRVAGTSVPLRKRNGASLPVELSTATLVGADGKELGVVAVLRDLTVVRELEAELRRTDRLAALGTMAAGLAHEIKNPLTSVRTFTRLAPRKLDDARFRETFERVVPRELERINGIVERLLELARPHRLRLSPVALPALLERAVELHANQIETRQITVEREYPPDLPVIEADAEHLYQALLNLVGNALDAMVPGGRLTLRARWSDGGTRAAPRRAAPPRSVSVEIEDTGIGIPPAAADKIFNPFFTTKDGGTGLGLAIAHKIIEDHGGTITFRSTPGSGTTFCVSLPVVGDRPDGRETAHGG